MDFSLKLFENIFNKTNEINSRAGEIELPPVMEGLVPTLIVTIGALLTVGILTFMISHFAYFPTKKMLNERKTHISKNISSAQELNTNAHSLFEKADLKYKNIEKYSSEEMNRIVVETNLVKKQILGDAELQAHNIIKEAKSFANEEVKKQKEKIQKELLNISFLATEKLLKENVSNKHNINLINEFIKEMEKSEKL